MNRFTLQMRLLSTALICQIMLLAPASAYGFGIVQRPPGGAQEVPWYATLGTFFVGLLVAILGGFVAAWAPLRRSAETPRLNTDTPGITLRWWCGYLGCSDDHVLIQLIADIQHDWHVAINRGDFAGAQRIQRNGYIDFIRTLIVWTAVRITAWVMNFLKNVFRAS